MKMVPLTDDEFKAAVLQKDVTEMTLAVAEFNAKQQEKAIELRLPQRQAEAQLIQTKEEFTKAKLNKKFFDKLVRNKAREVPDVEEPSE